MLFIFLLVLAASLTTQAYEYTGFEAWQTPQKSIEKTATTLLLNKSDFAFVSIGENDWNNYHLKLNLKPLSYGPKGVLHLFFRQEFLWSSYSLDITAEKTQLVRYDSIWDKYRVLAEGRGIQSGEEISITLEVLEDQIKVFFNSELCLEAESNKYKTGKLVLFSENVAFEASKVFIEGTIEEEYSSRDRGYLPQGNPKGGGVEHMVLIYGNAGTKWDLISAYPYVGYLSPLEENNFQIEFTDYLFDSVMFLALTAPNGYAFDSPSRGKPALKEQWQWYLDSLFTEGKQLAAFNEAMDKVNKQLGQERKIKIYIMIPNPMAQIKSFGAVDDTGSLNFSLKDPVANQEQRYKAVKWYLDQFFIRYEKANYKNLELIGFYWLQEIVDRSIPGELELLKEINSYLHARDLKFSWIPYFNVDGRREYETLGFDLCIYQSNYMFGANIPPSRLLETAKEAYKYRLGVEIEADISVLSTLKGREKLYDYFRAGLSYGFMTEATLAYYQDIEVFGLAATSSAPGKRAVYDNLYKFIKGTWEELLEARR